MHVCTHTHVHTHMHVSGDLLQGTGLCNCGSWLGNSEYDGQPEREAGNSWA